jgi:hypothetical protein
VPGSGRVSMADNGTLLAIVAGGALYKYDGTFAQVTDPDYPGAGSVDFVDGYFTFTEPNSGRFFSSDLYSVDFDALKFATAEGAPDDLVTHIVDHRQLVLFGKRSTEIWWNSGADNFPFERVPQGFLEIGCLGGVAKIDNGIFWVANDNTVRRLEGITPVRVSTHAVEEAFRRYTSAPYAFTYTLEGHLVYIVQFDEATWAYDVTTGQWHERESLVDGLSKQWRVCDVATVAGTVYVQDAITGSVGILDPDVFAEWGGTMRAEWTYPAVYKGNQRVFHKRLEIVCETGVGLKAGQGEIPAIVLSWSDDGGRTWTTAPGRNIGAIGDYRHRVEWHRLGSSRDRVYRCLVSDPVRLNVIGTELDAA